MLYERLAHVAKGKFKNYADKLLLETKEMKMDLKEINDIENEMKQT